MEGALVMLLFSLSCGLYVLVLNCKYLWQILGIVSHVAFMFRQHSCYVMFKNVDIYVNSVVLHVERYFYQCYK